MAYKWKYKTPGRFDDIILSSDGRVLTGVWFDGSRDTRKHKQDFEEKDLPIFRKTCRWFDIYFGGKMPDFVPRYRLAWLTPFQREVLEIMAKIPFGRTMTYGEIAQVIMGRRGTNRMSSQAIGGAVGANPICIILPCHRVIGKNGNLTGFGGGINNKIELLKLEGVIFDD